MTTGPRALLITGAVGVGKTTVTDAVGEELAAQGVAGAAIDLDWLRRSWPAPDDDPFQSRLELENLRLVAGTYRAAGALVLVAAGVLEAREDRPAYEVACGCPLTVVRLTAPRDLVRERLHRRHPAASSGISSATTSSPPSSMTPGWRTSGSRSGRIPAPRRARCSTPSGSERLPLLPVPGPCSSQSSCALIHSHRLRPSWAGSSRAA